MASRQKMHFRWWFSPRSWLVGVCFIHFPYWGSVHLGPVELCWSRLNEWIPDDVPPPSNDDAISTAS